ncbi:DUF192 domain-containing protein [uncultured Cohaesibacter sp.]|uniref:DUF192 domain-containing protein n=1 Tax=uncultured Cohaesibacter sp. TaxID=1002546 RepID=UPI0029C62273|nr:DUF192 domain-containing protein [uncultured Cohaesibacter sp.]
MPFIRHAKAALALIILTASFSLSGMQASLAVEPAGAIKPLKSVPTDSIAEYLSDQTHLVIESANGNSAFVVELALDDATRMKGLMFRTSLADGHGMLFDFDATEPVFMWMKNTYISLDMIFAEEDGTIHHIVKATTPLSESVIGSAGPVRYVLEVPKGTADKLGIKPGDKMLHQLFTPKSSK